MSSTWIQQAYIEAFRFAAKAHGEIRQRVPGTDLPYICHVSLVAMEVMAALAAEPHRDRDLAVQCALLHDTLEDTRTTHANLLERFGRPVADGVAALSKKKDLDDKQAQMQESLDRIRQQPEAVWMVKLADRITNLAPPPAFWKPAKIAAYRGEASIILNALGTASPFLAERLQRRIDVYPNAT